MLNYIKSELYRAVHSIEIRETAAVLVGLVFLMNLVLFFLSGMEHFRYGTTSFSYSNIVGSPMLYCYVAADVAAMLYESDKERGAKKNSIAYGISRMEILAGRCIVAFVTSLVILLLILPVYIGSAELLLEHAGPTTVRDMLMEIPAVSLIATAGLILAVVLLEVFDKSILSVLTWIAVMVLVPKILFAIGAFLFGGTGFLMRIAPWMPSNFFMTQMQVYFGECNTLWDTAEGMAKCLISGGLGIVIFGAAGAVLLRKKEI